MSAADDRFAIIAVLDRVEYADELVRTPAGWRSRRRVARSIMNQGDASLLGPGATGVREPGSDRDRR